VTEVLTGFDAAQRARVAALRAQGRFFWLDVSLSETDAGDLVGGLGAPEAALRALPGSGGAYTARTLHANGESLAFTLRCYVEGAPSSDQAAYRLRPLEVRVVVTADYLLTLHDEPISLPTVLGPDLPEGRSSGYVVYAVLDAMIESTFGALDEIEVRLERLAETWTGNDGGGVPRAALQAAGTRLASMRRWVTAQKAVLQRAGVEIGALHGFDDDDDPYFNRLDEQLDDLLASIDAAADALGMLLDLQLNERAYLVSVLATIFVPLTFITGFFGMNFDWMIDQIDSRLAFWLLGMAIPVATAALSWRFLLRRFVVGDDRRARSR
jgi:magnesium transporter